MLRMLIDYTQESRRAGRDDLPSKVVIVGTGGRMGQWGAWLEAKLHEIQWQPYASCWYCRAPQALCTAWQARVAGGWQRSGRQCQYTAVLTTSVFALWMQLGEDEARRIGHAQMAADGQGGLLEPWLGKKRMIGSLEASNMCRMLLLLESAIVDQE